MKLSALNQNTDFRRLYYRGKSSAGKYLVTYAMRGRSGGVRIGISSSKKIGNAVKRNRARRVIRAAYKQLESKVCGRYDIVFVARTATCGAKMQQVLADMERQLAELGVIK